MTTIALTRQLARAIGELASATPAAELLIEHHIERGGETVTVTERQRERRLLAEFRRPFECAEWSRQDR